ncbi:Hypothetical protein NCS54_01399700 [Fusarium falciforme]|uniref:Hypothetical protein n=1 Tax=Fusarium falciforme TaxID=195108 RepID=UPI002301C188|nr:Hypothetical protein NCS54_01399700 [Fusarium falciforme]WAO96327.1 Hypothetical protein NCS54_01399700 [Fusarium falciforme]
MTERRPPTPATGDDSLSMGPPKKFLEAEECALMYFDAETYPGGEPLPHTLWFHESWTGFDAPMNILFGEMDDKPMVFILPHTLEGIPKREIIFEGIMRFHGPKPKRSEQGPSGPDSQADNQDADAGRRSTFRDSADRARGMFSGIRLPTFRFPSAQWWYNKLKLLVKALLILAVIFAVIFAGLKLVHHGPQLREMIVSKFESISQGRSHTDHFNADRDHFNMGRDHYNTDKDPFNADKEQVKADTHNSKADQDRSKATKATKATKDRSKAAKDQFETNRDNIKTDKGQFKFDKNADGNHIRGSWTKPDDTRITFEASKTSGDHVTEIRFVQSEEQFIKDENDKVLFSLNRITRFFVTLIGGDEHDEKLDKIIDGIGTVSSRGNTKASSRWWWWW